MKIFGVDVNPYELFLILILLLAATGAFDAHAARAGKDSSQNARAVRFLKAEGALGRHGVLTDR